mgnify:CR=1 FL=1
MEVNVCASSGKKTASGVITPAAKSGLLVGAILVNGGAAATLKLLDDGASGSELAIVSVPGTTAGNMDAIMFNKPVQFNTDIYATLAGASAYYYVFFVQTKGD